MGRPSTVLLADLGRATSRTISTLSPRTQVAGIIAVFAVLGWVISVTPAIVSAALAVGLAAAWCRWLERHPDVSQEGDGKFYHAVCQAMPASRSVHVFTSTSVERRCALAIATHLGDVVGEHERGVAHHGHEKAPGTQKG